MPLRQTRPGSYERTNCGRIRLVPGHTRAAKYYYGLSAVLLVRSIMYFTVKAMTSRPYDPTARFTGEFLNHFSFAGFDSSGPAAPLRLQRFINQFVCRNLNPDFARHPHNGSVL